jgi:DNA-binding CsgD family transcriptional regulator
VAFTPAELVAVRAARRIHAAECGYRAEDYGPARSDMAELVAELPAGDLRAEALLWLATINQAAGDVTETIGLVRRALAEARAAGLRAAAERDLALALVIVGQTDEGDRHAAAALETARSTGDPESIAESEAAYAWTRFWLGAGLRRDLLDGARHLPRWTRFAPQEASPNVVAGLLLSWADELEEARWVLVAEDRRLAEAGDDRPRALVLFALCELECRAGSWDAAWQHAERGGALAVLVGDDFARALLLYGRGLVQAHRGLLGEARADAEAAIKIASDAGTAVVVGFALALSGFVELTAGDHDAVARHLAPLAARVPADGRFDPGLARFVPDLVETLVAEGRHAEADALLAPFEAQARALDRPWALGAAGRCRALLLAATGDLDAALVAAGAAVDAHDRVELPFERARTLLVAGSVRRKARRLAAREALDAAFDVFTRLGAPAWAARAEAERARIGGRAPSGRALTEAERRIAELVVAGSSNRQVADELFVAVATVESALYKVYRKLGVRSRTELAVALLRDRS